MQLTAHAATCFLCARSPVFMLFSWAGVTVDDEGELGPIKNARKGLVFVDTRVTVFFCSGHPQAARMLGRRRMVFPCWTAEGDGTWPIERR